MAFIGSQKGYLEVQIQKEGRGECVREERKKGVEQQIFTSYLQIVIIFSKMTLQCLK